MEVYSSGEPAEKVNGARQVNCSDGQQGSVDDSPCSPIAVALRAARG